MRSLERLRNQIFALVPKQPSLSPEEWQTRQKEAKEFIVFLTNKNLLTALADVVDPEQGQSVVSAKLITRPRDDTPGCQEEIILEINRKTLYQGTTEFSLKGKFNQIFQPQSIPREIGTMDEGVLKDYLDKHWPDYNWEESASNWPFWASWEGIRNLRREKTLAISHGSAIVDLYAAVLSKLESGKSSST